MMNSVKGSLVLVDGHTPSPGVFWNGSPVTGIVEIYMHMSQGDIPVMSLTVDESPVVASMRDAGITVTYYDPTTPPDPQPDT